jgi:hypothetical protein
MNRLGNLNKLVMVRTSILEPLSEFYPRYIHRGG